MYRIALLLIGITSFQVTVAQTDVIDNTDYNMAVDYYNTARMDYDTEQFESAIDNFRKAYVLNTNNSDYPFGLASSFYELKAYDSAKKYIEIAIQLEPNQPDYHNRAGNIYFHSKDYKKAVANYQITLANLSDEYPINVMNCYYNKAVSEYYLKDYKAAILDLSTLIKEDPEDYSYLHLRGVAYLKMNRKKEACIDLNKAKDLGSENSKQYIDRYCK